MRTLLLQGQPGSGKTWCALTAPRRPIVVIDVDGKCPEGADGVVVHRLDVPLVEGRLDHRLRALVDNTKPPRTPQGWLRFAELVETILGGHDPVGTLVVDSWSQLMDHCRELIMHWDRRGHATMSDRNYGTFLSLQAEAVSQLRSACERRGADLIVTVHEKVSDLPTADTRATRIVVDGVSRRQLEGEVKLAVTPAIEGQFSTLMPAYFTDAYLTFVELDVRGTPRWQLRVVPDGVRPLRFWGPPPPQAVVEPDLAKLWG